MTKTLQESLPALRPRRPLPGRLGCFPWLLAPPMERWLSARSKPGFKPPSKVVMNDDRSSITLFLDAAMPGLPRFWIFRTQVFCFCDRWSLKPVAACDGLSPQSLLGDELGRNIVCSTFALITSQSFFSGKTFRQLLERGVGGSSNNYVVNKELKSTEIC